MDVHGENKYCFSLQQGGTSLGRGPRLLPLLCKPTKRRRTELRRAREVHDPVARELQTYIDRSKNVARKRLGEAIRTSFSDYGATFDKTIAARQRRQSIVEERLNPLGAEMRQYLSTLIAAAVAEKDWETAALTGQAQE